MSYDKVSKSLIDHVFLSSDLTSSVNYCNIFDDDCFNVSSHRPIVFAIEISNFDCVKPDVNISVNWKRVT